MRYGLLLTPQWCDKMGGEWLLAAILASPADDHLRLVYADWLEERGEEARAEFIRVQIAVASCSRCGGDGMAHGTDRPFEWSGPGYPGPCPKCGPLRHRERELLRHCWKWWPTEDGWWNREWRIHSSEPRILLGKQPLFLECLFRRGFIASVTCRLADWCGTDCCECGGKSDYSRYPRCPVCHGTGRIGAHGIEIMKAQPVKGVRATDVTIQAFDGEPRRCYWMRHQLPDFIWELIESGDDCGVDWKLFYSLAAANAALSAALIAWAKSKSVA